MDANWLGHPLAKRLIFMDMAGWLGIPISLPRNIAREWTQLSFGNDPVVVQTISNMLLTSWPVYESYTVRWALERSTDIRGSHYGPGVESSGETAGANGTALKPRWDQGWIVPATGTGYVLINIAPPVEGYESLSHTPDELLLFFHHVPYTYVLHSRKTVIQHIYDSDMQARKPRQISFSNGIC